MKLIGNRCRCSGCGEHFNSGSAFDGHRVGTFGTFRKPGSRRCLTVAEMQAKGWLSNAAGFWITSKCPAIAVTTRAGAAIGPDPSSEAA